MHKKRIFKFFRSTISVALAITLMVGEFGTGVGTVYAGTVQTKQEKEAATEIETTDETEVSEEVVNGAAEYGLVDNIQDGTILHCFDWKYNDIKAELANIAEAGFTAVQTSPAQRDDSYAQWYMLYQPQSFSISTNALGSKSDLQALCSEAEKYGIKIIVDVVANHMRGDGENVDDSMKKSSHRDYWHHDDLDSGRNIDWTNRYQVTHGRIGMYDLNSENAAVQNIIAGYIDELKSVGADGIRWDAAKHIGLPSESCNFWPAVTSQGLFHYGEILDGPNNGGEGNDAKMAEYTKYMTVTDDVYGHNVLYSINSGQAPTSIGNYSERGVAKNKLIYWPESHDTYSNNGEYGSATQKLGQNVVDRAYAIVAAQAKSTALYFSRPFSTEKASIKAGEKGSTHFTSKEVAAVNHLKNACVGEKEYYVSENGVAAVCRESGASIVKASGSGQVSVKNGGGLVAPGTYTDAVSGSTWTVTTSTISGSIGDSGIAVICNKSASGASISASLADGSSFTTDTTNVTFTVSNAKSASYSIDGGTATSFTDSVKLTLGEGVAFGNSIKVKVTATNEEGKTTEKTFTYKKKEAGKLEKNTVYFTKPSGWGKPNIYAYVPGETATDLVGKWPGTAMTDEGDGVYSYTFADSVSTAKVIFNDGTNQTPEDVLGESCGYDYVGGKAYEYDGSWKALEVSTATNTPTPKPTNTPKPKATNTPKPTNTPIPDGPDVIASMADGTGFDTEIATVKLTLSNAEKGTYSVDNGPVKEFTGSANVVIGKGKIADSDVTVKVTAIGDGKTTEKTFTYKKNYVPDVAAAPEEAVEETTVNAAAETGGMYATNPNGNVGKEATITIDGSFSDWSEDMLIAQGGAWDIANNWKGGHENCVLDDYALYAAWDDTNLYIGWQMVNTADTWANSGDGPLSDGGRVLDVPLMLALNVGNRPAMTGQMANGKLIWDALDVSFETRVDNILLMSGKVGLGTPGYFIASDASGGASYDPEFCLSFKTEGISYKMAEGCLPKTIMGLAGSDSPSDVYDASKYVDMMGKGHSTTYDSFYEINIPLKTLGIDKSYIEQNGIGVMQIATRGTSGIDCIPHDPTMLDNATGDCAVDPSTSHEKDDSDVITVPLASVGKLKDPSVVVTTTPVKTPTPVPTQAEATATPVPTEIPSDVLHVNFGADRSAPQYTTTALSVKAIAAGGEAPYNYEFFVDGTSVQNSSSDTYAWQNGSAGAHTIKVIVTDISGKTVTSEKDYDLEGNGEAGVTVTVTVQPTVEPTKPVQPTQQAKVTATPTTAIPTEAPSLLALTKFTIACKTADGSYKVGDEFVMRAESVGANGIPQYMFTYVLNGEEVIVKNYGPENEASFVADTAGAYGFKVYVVDNGNEESPFVETGEIVVQSNQHFIPTTKPGTTGTPQTTEAPKVTSGAKVTETPVITGIIPTPQGQVTVKPIEPDKQVTKTPEKKPTKSPTKKPTSTPVPTSEDDTVVEKGTIVIDEKTESDYTVISTGSNKTVEFTGYYGTVTNFVIPDTIKIGNAKYKVTSIAESAFEDNEKLKAVTIGSNITKIGDSAFYGCTSLIKVKGGKNVNTIGEQAFYNCKKLNSITLSSKLTTVGKSAFYKCISLKKLTIPSSVSKIGAKAFYGCKKLKTITIKTKKLTSGKVGKQAFKGIYSKATIKVPKSKLNTYKKLLKNKGVGSKVKIKK